MTEYLYLRNLVHGSGIWEIQECSAHIWQGTLCFDRRQKGKKAKDHEEAKLIFITSPFLK
jgi:hypothetical protein